MQRVTSFVLVAALALALAGAAIAKKEPSNSDAGTGTVFVPGPVSELGIQTLTDQKDADYPALAPAYHNVQLTELDGSGFRQAALIRFARAALTRMYGLPSRISMRDVKRRAGMD